MRVKRFSETFWESVSDVTADQLRRSVRAERKHCAEYGWPEIQYSSVISAPQHTQVVKPVVRRTLA